MLDTLRQFALRWYNDAYDPFALTFELLLIGVCVNWCAGVLRGTRGTRMLRGLLIVLILATLIVRVISVQMGWVRLELLYRYFIIGLGFIALVAFQPELRRAFLRAGDVSFLRRGAPQERVVPALVEAAGRLSRARHGALVAIQRDVALGNWVEHGAWIDAEVTADLLTQIFYPNSPLHDLGVVIQNSRIAAANCQFPQADPGEADPALGSRHRAAIALSNESDALVLIVSEETGSISIADRGELVRHLSLTDLDRELRARLTGPQGGARVQQIPLRTRLIRGLRRAAAVVPVTLVIWFVTDQASQIQADGVKVAISIASDPDVAADFERAGAELVNVSFRGPTRAIDRLRLDAAAGPIRANWTLPSSCERPGHYDFSTFSILEQSTAIRTRGLTVQRVAPESVAFNVDRVIVVSLPVRAGSGAIRVEDVRCEPAQARAWVRERDLKRVPEEQRFVSARVAERLAGIATGQSREFEHVPLERQLGAVSALRVEPEEVGIALRVVGQNIEQRIAGVVVQCNASPQVWQRFDIELSDPNEWVIDVMVEGERGVIDQLKPTDVRAFIAIAADAVATSDFRAALVQFTLPAGVRVTGAQRQVRYRLVVRAAGAAP
ncbi:MAG: diadenylate cyclase [Phycisphaerae bacterium]